MSEFIFRTTNERFNNVEFSFCIPTYKRTKYLEEAIDSILHQKNKYNIKFEVLIVNNDPSDMMVDLIDKYKEYKNVHFISNEINVGMLGNMNQCWNIANGKYISFLHDDDYLLPNYLDSIYSEILYAKKTKKNCDCIITRRYLLMDKVNYKKIFLTKIISFIFLFRKIYRKKLNKIKINDCLDTWRNCFLPPTCGTVFLRHSLEKYGGIKGNFGLAWDFDFFISFSKTNSIYVGKNYSAVYRVYSGLSNKIETQYDFYCCFENMLSTNKEYLSKYQNEIAYLNYYYHTEEVRKYIDEKNGKKIYTKSKFKYIMFQTKRLFKLYIRNLDNEKIKVKH